MQTRLIFLVTAPRARAIDALAEAVRAVDALTIVEGETRIDVVAEGVAQVTVDYLSLLSEAEATADTALAAVQSAGYSADSLRVRDLAAARV